VALLLAVALQPLRLAGVSLIAAFLTCVYFVSGLQFSPLTATRKIVLLGIASAVVGPAVDFAFRPTRGAAALLAVGAAAATLWVFWPVLAQKPVAEALLLGGTAALTVAALVGFAQDQLAGDALRAGTAALALGLGAGVAAIFSASASYGLYGIGLAAGAGGFLLPQMLRGKKALAGATFVLPAMFLGGLVAAGAMILAQLPWYAVLVLGVIPVGVRMRGLENAPLWLQSIVLSLYGFAIAAAACALAWPSSHPT
jgi:hypothetical protein